MEKYLNTIQLISGIIAIVLIFAGLFLSTRKLSKEDSTKKIPTKTVIISTILIAAGLLVYAITKTCTNYANRDQEYDISVLYLFSLISVIKYFGFVMLLPLLFNYIRRRPGKDISDDNEETVA